MEEQNNNTMAQTPATPAPAVSVNTTISDKGGSQYLYILLVLILAAVVAAVLIKKADTTDYYMPETSGQVQVTEDEPITSTSDEIADIEADMEALDMADIDADLQ